MVLSDKGEILLIGRYPPLLMFPHDADMLTVLLGFNRRGAKHAVVFDEEMKLRGMLSLRDVVDLLGGGERWKRLVVEERGGDLYRALVELKASDLMVEDTPYVVVGETRLDQVVEMMMDHKLGALPVVTKELRVVGMISERHISELIIDTTMYVSVKEIMSSPVVTAELSTSVKRIQEMMTEKRIRRIPLLDSLGSLAGIVTMRDVIRYYAAETTLTKIKEGRVEEAYREQAKNIGSHRLATINENRDVSQAVKVMRAHGVGCLPVLDNEGRLAGIITERDILTKLPKRVGVERFVDTLRHRIFIGRVFF